MTGFQVQKWYIIPRKKSFEINKLYKCKVLTARYKEREAERQPNQQKSSQEFLHGLDLDLV